MTYEYPDNPYSWGNTKRMSDQIRQEKEDAKKEELEKEREK